MRLIDADKIYVIPAEDDNITGMGMTPNEQDAYNDGIDVVMSKIRNAETVDAVPIDWLLAFIDKIQFGEETGELTVAWNDACKSIKQAVLIFKGGDAE